MSRKLKRSDIAPPARLVAKGILAAVDVGSNLDARPTPSRGQARRGNDGKGEPEPWSAAVGTLAGVIFKDELEAWAARRVLTEPKRQRHYLGRKHTVDETP
jgi:hypothetical protein